MVDGTCSSTAPGCRICSRFPLPRRSMARCPRAGKFPAERKNRFLHGRRRLPAREALGGRLVSAGDGISGQLHISDIQKDHTLAVTFEPVPTATPTPTATATPTETPAITQTPEPAISKAPASSTVSFSSVASHFAAFWKGTVHAASWFRHLASAGASLFARIRKADPVFLAMPFVLLVLILLFVLRLRYVRRIRRERSRKALEHRRRTYEELVREFTENPKDEKVSIDELLLTIDELQKEEQKNT